VALLKSHFSGENPAVYGEEDVTADIAGL